METSMALHAERHRGGLLLPMILSEQDVAKGAKLIGKRQALKLIVEPTDNGYALTPRGERELSQLVRLIRTHRPALSGSRAGFPAPSPYHADRAAQRLELARIVRRPPEAVAGPTPLPILVGRREDRPDKFALSQIPNRLLPRVLGERSIETYTMPWPAGALRHREQALAWLDQEIGSFANGADTWVVYCQPAAEDMRSEGGPEACVRLWCDLWERHARDDRKLQLPFLDLREDCFPAPRRLWWRRERFTLWERVQEYCGRIAPSYRNVAPICMPAFTHVSWACVEEWLHDEGGETLDDHRGARLRAALANRFDHSGMPMEIWADSVRAVLEDETERTQSKIGGAP